MWIICTVQGADEGEDVKLHNTANESLNRVKKSVSERFCSQIQSEVYTKVCKT